MPAKIVEYRALAKLKGTYIDALPALVNPETGRLHTSFNQAVAATGRLSSSDPNLQNIPIRTELGRRIRRAFIARRGTLLVSADYSQIELRILAHFSEDPAFLEAFRTGEDIHLRTAAEVFGCRRRPSRPSSAASPRPSTSAWSSGRATSGWPRCCGSRARRRAPTSTATSPATWACAHYMERAIAEARARGEVTTLLGRRRPLPEIRATRVQDRDYAERIARNTPIQGTAADLLKLAMIRVEPPSTGKGAARRADAACC